MNQNRRLSPTFDILYTTFSNLFRFDRYKRDFNNDFIGENNVKEYNAKTIRRCLIALNNKVFLT